MYRHRQSLINGITELSEFEDWEDAFGSNLSGLWLDDTQLPGELSCVSPQPNPNQAANPPTIDPRLLTISTYPTEASLIPGYSLRNSDLSISDYACADQDAGNSSMPMPGPGTSDNLRQNATDTHHYPIQGYYDLTVVGTEPLLSAGYESIPMAAPLQAIATEPSLNCLTEPVQNEYPESHYVWTTETPFSQALRGIGMGRLETVAMTLRKSCEATPPDQNAFVQVSTDEKPASKGSSDSEYSSGSIASPEPSTRQVVDSLTCPICLYTPRDGKPGHMKSNSARHRRGHYGKAHKCPWCPQKFARTDNLRTHRSHVHGERRD